MSSPRFAIGLTALILTFTSFRASEAAEHPVPEIRGFLTTHCADCHADGAAEGDFRLEALSSTALDGVGVRQWQTVLRRIEKGEMPPADADQPTEADRKTLRTALRTWLSEADRKRQTSLGRGTIRRLNRSEYETALSDLFQMPLRIRKELPEDAKSHGFATVGSALNVSTPQIEAYLDVLDNVLDEATTLYPQPKRRTHRLSYREENGIMQVYRRTGPFEVRDDGVAFFATEKFSHLNAVLSQWTAPHRGRYRIKVSAYAVRSEEPVVVSLRAGGTGHAESNHVPHVFLDHFTVKEGKPQVFTWEGHLERGHYLHAYPTSLRPMRFVGKEDQEQANYEGPGAVIQYVEVDGPIFDQWPPASHELLWNGIPRTPLPDAQPNEDPIAHLNRPPSKIAKPKMTRIPPEKENGNRWIYSPKQKEGGEPIHRAARIPKPLHAEFKLVPRDPKGDAERLLTNFANRACRRPISREELAPFVSLVHQWLDEGRDFESAMRVGYKALLTSPAFLYHQASLPTASAKVEGHALAERLAFFLWNGLPDAELTRLAESGRLSDPQVLRQQVDRMLNDSRSDRFVHQFLDSWLDLELIDFTTPDEKLYPEYDKLLGWSMTQETRAFIRRLIDEDLSSNNLVESDFAMLNSRLAKHYELDTIEGMDVRPVRLPSGSIRGGLLTQASILKVTANGTTTSPVVRGVWVLERIMGEPPSPPPPGVPAIEPDIRGATTVREQLAKHRNTASCAVCHVEIDPPGVALESFDVIGGYRDRYRALNEKLVDIQIRYSPKAPPPIRYVQGLPVDVTSELPDGREFDDVREFQQLLLDDPRQIARNLVEKLTIYSTGAEISIADEVEIEAVLDRAQPASYGVRTLVREVVLSPLFLRK